MKKKKMVQKTFHFPKSQLGAYPNRPNMNIVDCTNRNSFPRDLYILTLVCVRRQQGIQKERTSRFGDARGQHTIKS